ncbi:MAG: mandelate racemase/muconate lactonizing enzyme family protein [Pseudomonadota bacterium]
MKITRISVYRTDLPLTKPYWLSGGRLRFDELDSTLFAVEADDGQTGWGEGCPWGHTYLPAHGAGIRAAAELLAPALLGQDPRELDKINRIMDLTLPGHLYAKAGLDVACWDLFGQSCGLPLAELMGGRESLAGAPIASSISTGAPEEMLAEIQSYRDRGYFAHSAKVGGDTGLDVARIRHLEAERNPGETIVYDVNRAWSRQEAVTVMNQVADLGVTVEQPCETIDDCAAVSRRTGASICLDERLETQGDLTRFIADGIGEVVNIKINRVGGLTKARRLRDLAEAGGLRMLIMESGGSVIADTGAAHLAATVPDHLMIGSWLCHDMLSRDLAPGRGARNDAGRMAAPTLPGLGVAPDLTLIGAPVAVYE